VEVVEDHVVFVDPLAELVRTIGDDVLNIDPGIAVLFHY
jgi:hypothetical protein